MNKKLILIIIVALLLVAGAVVYFFVIKPGNDKEKPPTYYEYAVKDPFITNVKSSSKLFKTSVVLVLDDKKVSEKLGEQLYTIRDTILFVLRDMTESDFKNQSVQDNLRKTLPDKLNAALNISNIVSVRFSDFVMQ